MFNDIRIDTRSILQELGEIQLSIHCWQGDDVRGFEDKTLTGGIQVTGGYMGRARTPEELMADLELVISLVPGKHRLNLHANYAVMTERVDRDQLKAIHFKPWVDFAKKHGLGLDFNPTFFSHDKATGLTLSSPDESIREFWINHGQACLKISEYFASELDTYCLMNIWIPDGFKDIPADRMGPRQRLKNSLDQMLSLDYDRSKVKVAVESKVFGIGIESYTVGSHEFYMNYANENDLLCLLDNGHYHPTESVADKVSAMLLFKDELALHVTRSVRWDSDHVILLDDEIKAIAEEIVKSQKTIYIGLDFFDASINRIAAWVIGIRNMQKALLLALMKPHSLLQSLQDKDQLTELMMLNETLKTQAFDHIWQMFCDGCGVASDLEAYKKIMTYEKEVLSSRMKT